MIDRTRNQHNAGIDSPSTSLRSELLLALLLVVLIVGCRWGIDLPNFKPVMAVAMLGGFLFCRQWLAIGTVVTGMLLADALLGFYAWKIAVPVYFALLFPIMFGWVLRRCKDRPLSFAAGVGGFATLSALNFFLMTNTAVWFASTWYASNFAGWLECMAMGVPFLKWSLMGNLFFSVLLFGTVGIAESVIRWQENLKSRQLAKARNPK